MVTTFAHITLQFVHHSGDDVVLMRGSETNTRLKITITALFFSIDEQILNPPVNTSIALNEISCTNTAIPHRTWLSCIVNLELVFSLC